MIVFLKIPCSKLRGTFPRKEMVILYSLAHPGLKILEAILVVIHGDDLLRNQLFPAVNRRRFG